MKSSIYVKNLRMSLHSEINPTSYLKTICFKYSIKESPFSSKTLLIFLRYDTIKQILLKLVYIWRVQRQSSFVYRFLCNKQNNTKNGTVPFNSFYTGLPVHVI